MKVVLISTYEIGRQPFSLASPAAWLRQNGHSVTCIDTAITPLPADPVVSADVIAISLPMHTATRLAVALIDKIKQLNSSAHLCCYGLYAPLNHEYLRSVGVQTILGGEFEAGLVSLMERVAAGQTSRQTEPLISLDRLQFIVPDRSGLPPLSRYPKLAANGVTKNVGYTESSRGCKHLCRHCPVVPVYQGTFRVIQWEVVLEDIRRQVAAGAQHITFGDPDFFNGPTHARHIVEALHSEFPAVTYDATIKIEHLLKQSSLLPVLKKTGCLFVTSAVESVDDRVLEKLDKGHTRADFVEVVRRFREISLHLSPTFIPFTPWTTRAHYCDLLEVIADLDLIDSISPVQLALRLLIPAGSRLLELEEIQKIVGTFDFAGLLYRWKHADSRMDELAASVLRLVHYDQKRRNNRRDIFRKIWELAHEKPIYEDFDLMPRATVPYLDEPWYC